MANYNNRPIVAGYDSEYRTDWLTPDGNFQITLDKDTGMYTIAERLISRLGDSPMRVHWCDVLPGVEREIVHETLGVILYPFGSEPSPEIDSAVPVAQQYDDEPGEWLTVADLGGDE